MKIESEDIDLETLLNGSYFSIPRFQRPYSWTEDNIQDLWDDVMAAGGEDYFLGSMVVYKRGKQAFGVVDGQQRLTTLTVFLCVLRDALKGLGEDDLAAGIHQLVERKNRSNVNEYVLQTQTSFPFLQERILRFGEPDLTDIVEMSEEVALKTAHKALSSKVASVIEAVDNDASVPDGQKARETVDRVIQIRDSVLNLKLILVKLENEDDAYLIFETLNTRGKDLALSDLVKTHFTKLIKVTSTVDAVSEKWESVLQTIHDSSADLDSDAFIYHFWASRTDSVPQKKLYPVIKKAITDRNAKSYLSALVVDSKYYRAVHEPAYMWDVNEARVSRSLEAIQLFRLVQPTPALLSLVRAYKEKKIKLPKLIEALEAIEKFHFSFTAVTSSRSSGGISGMYSAFGRRLFEAADSNSAAKEIRNLVAKLRERVPPFDEFLASFRQIGYTNSNSKQKNLVRYILRRFALAEEYKFSVDFDELTIEHIAPQSLIGSGWEATEVGQLGNLMLLDPATNVKIGTRAFDAKLAELKAGGHSVPEDVKAAPNWTAKTVQSRTDRLAKKAYQEIWKI